MLAPSEAKPPILIFRFDCIVSSIMLTCTLIRSICIRVFDDPISPLQPSVFVVELRLLYISAIYDADLISPIPANTCPFSPTSTETDPLLWTPNRSRDAV